MNTIHHKREPQNRHPHMKRLLTALFVAAMVMILAVPAFAAEATANESAPDTEVSTSTPDLTETPADGDDAFPNEADPTPAPTSGPVTTIEELLDAIANANENDVIEFAGEIRTPSESVIGRADCPITIRRATDDACLVLGSTLGGNVRVQNITFDGAEIQSVHPLVYAVSPAETIEKCNFVNCIAEYSSALCIAYGDAFISDCHFDNNKGLSGAHLRLNSDGSGATIENCIFTNGYASDKGSVYVGTTQEVFLTGCTISGNVAETEGGGIYLGRGALSIVGSKIYGNTANGVAEDITKNCLTRLILGDDYATLVELYKSDGVIPNKWTVDSRYDSWSDPYHATMIFTMTFADNEPSPTPAPSPTSVTLDKSELTLDVGETDILTATLHPEGTSSSIQWTSSDPTIASVTESGFITAHSTGTAVITATAAVGRASASCRVNVQAVPATTYSISINASPVEGGTVSGGGQYEDGTTVTITAVLNEDFRFLAWTEADTQISTEACFTFTVTSDRTLTAIFEPISEPAPGPVTKPTYTINVSATVGGTASGGGEYEQGSSVTLAATPESEYLFIGWTENGEQVSSDESFTFVVEQDRTFVAVFEPIPKPVYTIQVNSTQGGVVDGGGSYTEGESVTVTATSDAGYRFLRWEENGVQASTEARFSFTAEADRTLIAIFQLIPYSAPDSTHEPSRNPGTPSTSYRPSSNNIKPTITSLSTQKEVQIPKLTNGKAVLIAPDDSFWVGYKVGQDNGTKTVTRADLAQLLYSMMDNESRKTYGVAHSPFRDVSPGIWCETAVGTMLNTGVMVGCGDGLFCPNRTLTWGELLTVFARFTADKPLTEYYTGAHWAKDAVNKAFTLGWLEYAEGFDPGKMVTTGEMVDLIQAVFQWNNK